MLQIAIGIALALYTTLYLGRKFIAAFTLGFTCYALINHFSMKIPGVPDHWNSIVSMISVMASSFCVTAHIGLHLFTYRSRSDQGSALVNNVATTK